MSGIIQRPERVGRLGRQKRRGEEDLSLVRAWGYRAETGERLSLSMGRRGESLSAVGREQRTGAGSDRKVGGLLCGCGHCGDFISESVICFCFKCWYLVIKP